MSHFVILIKILPSEWANDFLDGNLYLNTSVSFGQLDESDIVRFDADDGVVEALQAEGIDIEDEHGNWIPIGGIQNPVLYRSRLSENLNILCLYTITSPQGESFDSRNLCFGDEAIVILNLNTFINRVKLAAKSRMKRVGHGPVEYVDRTTHHGAMGPFRKFNDFKYQNEFRFVFSDGNGQACRLAIGSIRDITTKIRSADIPSFWQSMLGRRGITGHST